MNNGDLKGFQKDVKHAMPIVILGSIGCARCSTLIFLLVIVVAVSLKMGLWIIQW